MTQATDGRLKNDANHRPLGGLPLKKVKHPRSGFSIIIFFWPILNGASLLMVCLKEKMQDYVKRIQVPGVIGFIVLMVTFPSNAACGPNDRVAPPITRVFTTFAYRESQ